MGDAGPFGQLVFEGVDVGPCGRDPVGIERLEEHPPLFVLPPPAGIGTRGSRAGPCRIAQSADEGGGTENGHRHDHIDSQGHGHGRMA